MKLNNNNRFPPDIHMHTHYCGHASGEIEAMVLQAIELGMQTMGFSEHFYYPDFFVEPCPDCVIPQHDFPQYLSDIGQLQSRYQGQIEILIGAEIDFLPDFITAQQKNISKWPLDYVIGSIHMLDNLMIDFSEEDMRAHMQVWGGVHAMWDKYWDSIGQLIDMNVCDILGHLDLPRKFSPGIVNPSHYLDRVVELLDRMLDRGLALDVNTGGIVRSAQKEMYPGKEILKYAAQKKVNISMGSDAHRAEEIGRYFPQTIAYLKSLGWDRVVYFRKRVPFYFSLI